MDRSLKLSIIVPVYNVEKYLERCVSSLVNQDIQKESYEIILVNDGSTDQSGEIARRIVSQYDNIRLIEQENKGLSGARNSGMDVARGEYLMFVDSDDMLFPNVISKIVQTADDNNLDACAYRIIYYDAEGNKHYGSIQPFDPHQVYDGRYALTHGADIGAVWLVLYSRAMIEKNHLRFLEKIYHQDVDFNLRMYAYADRMMFMDLVAYCYCYNDTAISRVTSNAKAIKHISDDLTIVRHIRDFSENDSHGILLRDFYERHGNSLLFSLLLILIKQKMINYNEKLLLLRKMKDMRLYPIKGKTLSRKSTMFVPILNMSWLLKILIKLQKYSIIP